MDLALSHLWDVLGTTPGFTRQWQNLVQRIRDQLAIQAIPLLHQALRGGTMPKWPPDDSRRVGPHPDRAAGKRSSTRGAQSLCHIPGLAGQDPVRAV